MEDSCPPFTPAGIVPRVFLDRYMPRERWEIMCVRDGKSCVKKLPRNIAWLIKNTHCVHTTQRKPPLYIADNDTGVVHSRCIQVTPSSPAALDDLVHRGLCHAQRINSCSKHAGNTNYHRKASHYRRGGCTAALLPKDKKSAGKRVCTSTRWCLRSLMFASVPWQLVGVIEWCQECGRGIAVCWWYGGLGTRGQAGST